MFKKFRRGIAYLLLMYLVFIAVYSTSYASGVSAVYSEMGSLVVQGKESQTSATSIVDTSTRYTTTGGGYITYSSLVGMDYEGMGYVVEDNFQLLTNSSKRDFLEDLYSVAEAIDNANQSVTSDTISAWSKAVQTCEGVDAQLIAVFMNGMRPDFVTAMKALAPWQSPLGVVLGVVVLIIFGATTLSTTLDISFIAIPFISGLVVKDSKEKPWFISQAAFDAYLAESGGGGNSQGQGGSSGTKSAMFYYFRRRIVSLAVLMVTILYLASNKIWAVFADIMSMFQS